MLPLAVVEEVHRLLQEGKLSQRKIAAKLGVSRGVVGAIASGKRGIFGSEAKPDDLGVFNTNALPERCLGCGATVYKPCVLCQTRQFVRRQETLRNVA